MNKEEKNEQNQNETEDIIFPYLNNRLKERRILEEAIEKCNVLLEKQLQLNLAFNELIDEADRKDVRMCQTKPLNLSRESAIAWHLNYKLKLFDAKLEPIQNKYAFLKKLLKDIPTENFKPSTSTISVSFELDMNLLPLLVNRLTAEGCVFQFAIQELTALSTLKVRITDHLPAVSETEQAHLLVQYPRL